jgi:hypothetical protein
LLRRNFLFLFKCSHFKSLLFMLHSIPFPHEKTSCLFCVAMNILNKDTISSCNQWLNYLVLLVETQCPLTRGRIWTLINASAPTLAAQWLYRPTLHKCFSTDAQEYDNTLFPSVTGPDQLHSFYLSFGFFDIIVISNYVTLYHF